MAYAVMVTGVGGVTGQGVLQCLLNLRKRPKIIATDVSPLSTGLFWGDRGFVLPYCTEGESYLKKIKSLCSKYKVKVIFPGSDLEARALSCQGRWFADRKIWLATAEESIWKITGDKLEIFKMATSLNIPTPTTMVYSLKSAKYLLRAFGSPLVIKPRKSSGSRGIAYIDDADILSQDSFSSEYVVQPYLDTSDKEFTVGTYFSKNDPSCMPLAIVAMRRKLSGGNTVAAEIVSSELFEPHIRKIAAYLGTSGYCNFQFISENAELKLIDINARFSSSTSISLKMGCNFVNYYLNDFIEGRKLPKFRSREGKFVTRYLADYVIDASKVKLISRL